MDTHIHIHTYIDIDIDNEKERGENKLYQKLANFKAA
jgi:hypothetical protein